MDKIKITGLRVFAHHGVYAEENALGQYFIIDAEIFLDTAPAGTKDSLEDSINYAQMCSLITKCMTERCFKLIEAAAEHIARTILTEYAAALSVRITVQKPHAPIPEPVETVSVTIDRSRHTAYIGIGSNMGDKKAHLDAAVSALSAHPECRVMKTSSYIETEPVGNVVQDDFLNGVICIETLLTPWELLEFIHDTEKAEGRVRTIHWGPRTLDMDILLYDDLVLDTPDLKIPHVEMHKREFVLIPLCEIAPYAYHPVMKEYAVTLLGKIQ